MIKKDAFYFKHDLGARNDPKMIRLASKEGLEGLAIYWCLIEMLYEEGGYLNIDDIDFYADAIRTQSERIANVLQPQYKLFQMDGNLFFSQRVLEELEARKGKSDIAKKAAESRWNANAKRTHSKRNANGMPGEERRGEKKREKEREDKGAFFPEIQKNKQPIPYQTLGQLQKYWQPEIQLIIEFLNKQKTKAGLYSNIPIHDKGTYEIAERLNELSNPDTDDTNLDFLDEELQRASEAFEVEITSPIIKCLWVIGHCVSSWTDDKNRDKMSQHLNISTLFKGDKFYKYLDEAIGARQAST